MTKSNPLTPTTDRPRVRFARPLARRLARGALASAWALRNPREPLARRSERTPTEARWVSTEDGWELPLRRIVPRPGARGEPIVLATELGTGDHTLDALHAPSFEPHASRKGQGRCYGPTVSMLMREDACSASLVTRIAAPKRGRQRQGPPRETERAHHKQHKQRTLEAPPQLAVSKVSQHEPSAYRCHCAGEAKPTSLIVRVLQRAQDDRQDTRPSVEDAVDDTTSDGQAHK